MSVWVEDWTGIEARMLRQARRMSVREFAAHLGISDRMVSKWEAGGAAIRPQPANQAALDTSLDRCTPEERERFDQGRRGLPDSPYTRRGNLRWCLLVDLPPADVGLAARIASAIEAELAAERDRRPTA